MAHREDLLKAFHLEPDDLLANRAGRLSARQGRLLMRSGYFAFLAAAILCAGLAVMMVLVAQRPLKPVQWILSGGLGVLVVLVAVVYFRGGQKAIARGEVECLSGPVQVRRRGRSGYFLYVGARSFALPVKFQHVKNQASYRIYVTPGTDRLVAMEPNE